MENKVEIQEALNTFGKMLNIALIYGMDHPSIRAPLFETHLAFESALRDAPQITIGLFNNALTVNDKMISEYTIHLRALERRLISLDIPHLVIRSGLSAEELGLLVAALCTANSQEGQSLKEKLEEAGLSHIKTEEIEYVAQHEGEHMVGGEDGEGGGDGTADDGEGEGDEEKPEEPAPEPTVHVEQIVAFLKGETASSEAPSADLQEMLSDPEKLGQLIMESASVRQSVQSLDTGESLADIVIGCLRNTYEDLSGQKKFKSARGKASLNKAMLLLEKTVVDKIRNAVGEAQPEVDEQVLAALREMEEERQVDILAARYAEQHKKLTKAEVDILRYTREHGEERARELLDAADVPEKEWRRLMIRSRSTSFGHGAGSGRGHGGGTGSGDGDGQGGGTGIGSAESVDMGALAIVLDKLENIMHFEETPPALVRAIVDETRNGLADVSAQFENQIEELEEEIHLHEAEDADALSAQTSRADLLLQISQLALKLAQPLTVINASVEAALQQISNPELQKELLDLACESGLVMKGLMERLTQLVGYPTMQEADAGLAE